MTTYEQLLERDVSWALEQGSLHFERNNFVHKALEKIAHRLAALGVSYAVVGSMAMFFHGYRRFTEDVDLLVTPEDLSRLRPQLDGQGYVFSSRESRQARDAEYGVRIKFHLAGDYPGDGKPKPVSLPRPDESSVEIEGMPCLQLPRLVELKLAAGLANPGRLSDLGDAQRLLDVLSLPEEFADRLHPSMRAKYRELWAGVQHFPRDP